ncbi:hypothetical protein VTK26DRAFT_1666 [Humicola hyalothermophila]
MNQSTIPQCPCSIFAPVRSWIRVSSDWGPARAGQFFYLECNCCRRTTASWVGSLEVRGIRLGLEEANRRGRDRPKRKCRRLVCDLFHYVICSTPPTLLLPNSVYRWSFAPCQDRPFRREFRVFVIATARLHIAFLPCLISRRIASNSHGRPRPTILSGARPGQVQSQSDLPSLAPPSTKQSQHAKTSTGDRAFSDGDCCTLEDAHASFHRHYHEPRKPLIGEQARRQE